MHKTIQSQLLLIESLIKNKTLDKALRELDRLSPSEMNDRDKAQYFLILAEVKLRLGKYDYERTLQFALTYFAECNDNHKLAKAKFLSAWILISKGHHFDHEKSSWNHIYYSSDAMTNLGRLTP